MPYDVVMVLERLNVPRRLRDHDDEIMMMMMVSGILLVFHRVSSHVIAIGWTDGQPDRRPAYSYNVRSETDAR